MFGKVKTFRDYAENCLIVIGKKQRGVEMFLPPPLMDKR